MRRLLFIGMGWCGVSGSAQAGMTVYDLNDVVRLRLEDISFFAVLLLLSGLGIRFLWNYLARDFSRLPRLTYGKALCLTGLLSLLTLLVLSMISGARELLTPEAWRRQGHAYKLNAPGNETVRRQSLESLRLALHQYAQSHEGRFPAHDFVAEIPEKLWQIPDQSGRRYIYVGGLAVHDESHLLACEPVELGDPRLALLSDGEIGFFSTTEIRRLVRTSARSIP